MGTRSQAGCRIKGCNIIKQYSITLYSFFLGQNGDRLLSFALVGWSEEKEDFPWDRYHFWYTV